MTFKKKLTLLTAIFLMTFFSVIAAADPARSEKKIHSHTIGYGVGQTFLFGDYKDIADNHLGHQFFYSFKTSYSFDFSSGIHLSRHDEDNRDLKMAALWTNIKATFFDFDTFAPFVTGGFGFYWPRVEAGPLESKSKTVFGINFGVGADLQFNSHWAIEFLTHFHKPFATRYENNQKIKGSFFNILIALLYTF